MLDPATRFWTKVQPAGPHECWEWTGARQPSGHGAFGVGGNKVVRAHRWAYESLVAPIPDGLVIDHLCRNPGCVNPWHMEPVTQRVNVLRGDFMATIKAMRAAKTHCLRGHEYTPENTIRSGPTQKRTCRACFRKADRERKAAKRAQLKAAV